MGNWNATNVSLLCLKVISEGQKPPRHCFTVLLQRLPHEHPTKLKKLRPLGHPKKNKAVKASVQERKVACLAMDKHLKRHASSCYSWNATSNCCILHPRGTLRGWLRWFIRVGQQAAKSEAAQDCEADSGEVFPQTHPCCGWSHVHSMDADGRDGGHCRPSNRTMVRVVQQAAPVAAGFHHRR